MGRSGGAGRVGCPKTAVPGTEGETARLIEMWRGGATEGEIAREFGVGRSRVGGKIESLRAKGVDLPYRQIQHHGVSAEGMARAVLPPRRCLCGCGVTCIPEHRDTHIRPECKRDGRWRGLGETYALGRPS